MIIEKNRGNMEVCFPLYQWGIIAQRNEKKNNVKICEKEDLEKWVDGGVESCFFCYIKVF